LVGGAVLAVLLLTGWGRSPAPRYETAAVIRVDIEAAVGAVGTLQPRRYVDVGAQVSGQITRLLVQPGSAVRKGDLLVEIDPSVQQATVDAGRASLAGLRARLAEQAAQHRLAGQQLARQQQLAQAEATRLEDLQTAEAAVAEAAARIDQLKAQIAQTQATLKADEARLGYTRIYAPMDGTVVSVEAREGQTLNATYQTPNILRIADLSVMTVWTDVSEADVRRVKVGQPIYFTTLGGHGEGAPRRWESRVRQVLPAPPPAQAATGQGGQAPVASKAVLYTVLFDVDNGDGELMPQMTAQVSIVTAAVRGVLGVPLTAVEAGANGASVRLLDAGGEAVQRTVQLGVRSRHVAEVLSGLAEGDAVVVGERPADSGPRRFTW
jgi:macrolide-specific efflux system membrane fusion protein